MNSFKKISTALITFCFILCSVLFVACGESPEKKYKVNFYVDNAIVKTLEITGKESVISLPQEPTKSGFVFDGWYLDDGVWEEIFTANSVGDIQLSETINVYAKWELAGFTATFMADGSVVDTRSFNIETQNILEPNVPNKNGYSGEWEQYILGAVNIQINAVYTVIPYTINYTNTKGVENVNLSEYNVETDTFVLNALAKDGYNFLGWYDGSEKVTEIAEGTTGNKTLEAKWEAKTYTITYIDEMGVNNNNRTTYTIETETFTLNPLELYDYTFLGWYDGDVKVTQIVKGTTGNKTLRARWQLNDYQTFTITYVDTKGATNPNPNVYTDISETITLQPIDVEGYDFLGWYDGSTKVTTIAEGSSGHKIFTAKWTATLYTITYIDELEAENNNQTSYNIESSTFDILNVSASGYTFDGWFDAKNNKVETIEAGTIGDITLTAKWTIEVYDINYIDEKGATNSNRANYKITDETFSLIDLSCDGYNFLGWFDNHGKVTEMAKGTYGEITLTASWEVVPYTITYVDEFEVENSNVTTYNIETETITLTDLEMNGYNFEGWFDDEGNKVESIEKGTFGDITLAAKWVAWGYELIYTVDDFNNMELDGTYKLANDIDFKGARIVPIGTTDAPFTGSLDGSGFKIKNYLYIIGEQLFTANSGTIKNLTLTGFSLNYNSESSTALYYNGNSMVTTPFVGINKGTIDNCVVDGSVYLHYKNYSKYYSLSGFVGINDGGTITNSSTNGYLELSMNSSAGDATHEHSLGGFSVYNINGGIIKDCKSTRTIKEYTYANSQNLTHDHGNIHVGGFVTYNTNSTLENCSAVGDLDIDAYSEHLYVAGFARKNESSIAIKNCSYTGDIYARQGVKFCVCDASGFVLENAGDIDNSYSSGEVIASSYSGSIAYGFTNGQGNITNCYKVGLVKANWAYGMGISTSFEYCFVNGEITGGYYTYGFGTAETSIISCYTNSSISATNASMGIFIFGFGGAPTVTGCYVNGYIYARCTAESWSVKISGFAYNKPGTFTDCFTTASITVAVGNSVYVDKFSLTADTVVNNCYVASDEEIKVPDKNNASYFSCLQRTKEELKSISFQKETIKFSEDVWLFLDKSTPGFKGVHNYIYYHSNDKIARAEFYIKGVTKINLYGIRSETHDFMNWLDENGKEATSDSSNYSGDIHLYARWLIKYSVTLIDEFDETEVIEFNEETSTFELNSPYYSGYKFVGWFDDSGKEYKSIYRGTTENIVLTAKWVKEYTISFESEYGYLPENIIYTELQAFELPDIYEYGYEFLGWYDEDDQKIETIELGTAKDIHLTAKWIECYLITFHCSVCPSDIEVWVFPDGSNFVEPEVPEVPGYIIEWEEYTLTGGPMTVNAIVSYREFVITYENTKEAENPNPTTFTIETLDFVLKPLSLDGYVFDNWYIKESNKGIINFVIDNHLNDITLVARWFEEEEFISTPEELLAISDDGNYVLANDINMNGATIETIGMVYGKIEGDGHKIHNFKLNGYALFSTNYGFIQNLQLADFSVVVPSFSEGSSLTVGSLVQENRGEINNCSAVGGYIGIASSTSIYELNIGGLIGWNVADGMLFDDYMSQSGNNCYTDVDIELDIKASDLYVGGIASGYLDCRNCYALGDIDIQNEGRAQIGGICGRNSNVYCSYATGNINVYITDENINVYGDDELYVGGIVGKKGYIEFSYYTGALDVTGTGYVNVGGIVGRSLSDVRGSYATGNITAEGNSLYVGGIAGYLDFCVTYSYYSGNLTALGYRSVHAGLLCGRATGSNAAYSFASGDLKVTSYSSDDVYVGQIFGRCIESTAAYVNLYYASDASVDIKIGSATDQQPTTKIGSQLNRSSFSNKEYLLNYVMFKEFVSLEHLQNNIDCFWIMNSGELPKLYYQA